LFSGNRLKFMNPARVVVIVICLLVMFGFSIKPTTVSPPEVCLNSEEQKLYELMMTYRKSKGLEPIPISAKLTTVAQTHAKDLMNHYKFDFTNKCNPHSWSTKGKWSSCCYTSDHKQAKCMWDKPKEIAGYAGAGYEIAYYSSKGATAVEGLEGWKKSAAHNPLIINDGMWSKANWKSIGIGFYGEYGIVWFGELEDEVRPSKCN
jgi:uncharacterized protein YkwD